MNDTELLRRFVQEDSQDAFAELVRLRIELVYAAALRRSGGDTHRAQEITQAVFTELARNAASLCQHSALIGWLYTTTRYTAATMARTDRRRRAREQQAYTMHEDMTSLIPETQGERLRPILDDAMDRLSEIDRRALLLRFFDGYSMADLGRYLGISEPTAKKRVERALGKLKTSLARRGLSSTAAAVGAALSLEAGAATVPAGLAATVSGSALLAASTATPGIGLVLLMTAQKLTSVIGIATILGLISLGTGVYEWHKAQGVDAALEAVTQRYAVEQQQLRSLLQSGQAADKNLAELQREINKVASAGDPATSAGAKEKANWQRFTSAYPEYRSMLAELLTERTERKYRLAVERGDITPAQFEEIVNRNVDVQMQDVHLGPVGIFMPTELSDDQLRGILGDDAFERLQNSSRIAAASGWIAQITTSAGYVGAALSSDQEVQLAQIFANNSPTYQRGQSVGWDSEDWATVAIQAQSALSPPQQKAAEATILDWQYESALAHSQRGQGGNPAPSAGVN